MATRRRGKKKLTGLTSFRAPDRDLIAALADAVSRLLALDAGHDPLMTTTQAAGAVGISREAIRLWGHKGLGRFDAITGRLLIRKSELVAFVGAHWDRVPRALAEFGPRQVRDQLRCDPMSIINPFERQQLESLVRKAQKALGEESAQGRGATLDAAAVEVEARVDKHMEVVAAMVDDVVENYGAQYVASVAAAVRAYEHVPELRFDRTKTMQELRAAAVRYLGVCRTFALQSAEKGYPLDPEKRESFTIWAEMCVGALLASGLESVLPPQPRDPARAFKMIVAAADELMAERQSSANVVKLGGALARRMATTAHPGVGPSPPGAGNDPTTQTAAAIVAAGRRAREPDAGKPRKK